MSLVRPLGQNLCCQNLCCARVGSHVQQQCMRWSRRLPWKHWSRVREIFETPDPSNQSCPVISNEHVFTSSLGRSPKQIFDSRGLPLLFFFFLVEALPQHRYANPLSALLFKELSLSTAQLRCSSISWLVMLCCHFFSYYRKRFQQKNSWRQRLSDILVSDQSIYQKKAPKWMETFFL